MRSLSEILIESKKTYPFKIGIAGELPEGFNKNLESLLRKFDVLSLSAGKKTPIQERPLDFPNLGNIEVTYFDTELNYPTTTQILAEYINANCKIHASHIIVRNPTEPLEMYQNKTTSEVYEPLLTTNELGGESAQAQVGGNRIMELLKELEIARKEREVDPIAAAPVGESKDIDDSENSKSTIGSQ
jgi:hypothetical protein